MGKLAKVLAAVAAVLVVIVAGGALAVRLLLPPAKLKALVIAQADKTLHRKLEAESIELGLFTGLRVSGLRLSESPDFSRGELLKARSLTIAPRWLPLLHKQIAARSIELDGAAISIVMEKDGRFNFSDLGAGAAPPPPAKPAARARPGARPAPAAPAAPAATPKSSAVPSFVVGSLRLRDVKVSYVDRAQPAQATLDVSDARFDGLTLSGPFSGSLDAQAHYAGGGRRLDAAFKAKGRFDLGGGDLSRASADVSRFSLALQGRDVTGSLRLTGGAASRIAVSLSIPSFDAKAVNAAAGAAVLAPGTTLPAVEASLEAAYAAPRLDVTKLEASAEGARLSGSLSIPDVSSPRPRARVDLAARVGDLDAKLSGGVADLYAKAQTLDLRLQTNTFALASLASAVPALKDYGLTGSAAASAAIAGTTAAPRLSGQASLTRLGAAYRGQKLENLSGQARFTERSLDLPQLTGRLNGGDFRLKLAAGGGASPSVALTGWLSLLDLGALQKLAAGPSAPAAAPSAASPAGQPAAPGGRATGAERTPPAAAAPALRTTGDITVDRTIHPNFQCAKAVLSWSLSGVTPDMKRLAGTAKLEVGPGRATNLLEFAAQRGGLVRALVAPLEAVQKARALRIPGFNPPDMENVPFDKIEGNYAASRGVVSMQPFSLHGSDIGMTTTGTADLPAQTVNLKTAIKSSLGDVGLTITGPMSSPTIRPDVQKTLEGAGRKLLQEKGQELLNQWLKRR